MRQVLVLLIAVFVALCFAHGDHSGEEAAYEGSQYVLTVKDTDFDKLVAENDLLLEFFAPWCGHCKKLKPIYEQAAKLAAEQGLTVKFGALDATEANRDWVEQHGIQGFPTIKYFPKGATSGIEYDGNRTPEDFVSFVKKLGLPAVTYVATQEEADKLLSAEGTLIAGYFTSKDAAALKNFEQVASANRMKFTFVAVVADEASLKSFGAADNTVKVLFLEDKTYSPSISGDLADLADFVAKKAYAPLSELDQKVFQDRVASSTQGNFILFVGSDEKSAAVKKTLYEYAKNNMEKGNFFFIDGTLYARFAKNLGLSEALPSLAVLVPAEDNHFPFPESEELSAENIAKFVEDQIAGKLVRKLKSAPIPEDNKGPVTVLVGENFESFIADSTKDVLVEFYAPWCPHCKALAPIFDQVGQVFADVPSVAVANIDLDANEIDKRHGIKGFPTLKLFRANDKAAPVVYSGSRTYADIVKFVLENASIKIEKDIPLEKEAEATEEAEVPEHEEL